MNKKIISITLVVLALLFFIFVYYKVNYRISISTDIINNINGGLGTGNDISYIFSEIPQGLAEGDKIEVKFNFGSDNLVTDCELKSNTYYYCQATWPKDISALPDQEGYDRSNYIFTGEVGIVDFYQRKMD